MHLRRAATIAIFCAAGSAAAAGPANDATFDKDVVAASRSEPVVAYFQADWCKTCRKMLPQMEQAIARHGGMKLVVVDIDDAPRTAADLRITAIPALVGFSGGGNAARLDSSSLDDVRLTAFFDRVAKAGR